MSDRDLRIRVILDAFDRLTRPLQGIGRSAKGAGADVRKTREQIKQLKDQMRDVSAYRDHEQAIVSNALKLRDARARAAELKAEFQAAEAPTKKLAAAFTKARDTVARLEAEQHREQDSLRTLEARLQAAGMGASGLAAHEDRLRRETDEANRALKIQQDRLEGLARRQARIDRLKGVGRRAGSMASGSAATGGSALAGAGAIGAPIVAATSASIDFESAMADVKKVVTFDTPAQFEEMRQTILDMSDRLPVAASGLAQIMAEAGRAGVARDDLAAFTEEAAKLKVAFDFEDEGQAASVLTTWRNAFGFEIAQVATLADQINALTNKWGGHADAVAAIVSEVGPLAGVAGAGAAEVAALGQTLNSMGVPADVAATGIKNLLLRLNAGAAATPKQQAAFKALGLDAVKMSKRMQDDAGGAVTELLGKVARLDKFRQTSVLTQMFGSESVAPIGSMLSRLDRVNEALALVRDRTQFAGSADREYASRADTTANKLELARNNYAALGIVLGDTVLPALNNLSAFSNRVTSGFRQWAQAHPKLAALLMKIAAITAVVVAVVGALALAFAAVVGVIALIASNATIAAWVAGILAAFAVLTAAIVGLVRLFGWLWGKVKVLFDGATWKKLGQMALRGLIDGMSAMIPGLAQVVGLIERLTPGGAGKGGKPKPGAFSKDFSEQVFARGRTPPPPGPVRPATAQGRGPTTINVHPSAGMDEKALARAVAEEVDKRDRQGAAGRRSAYRDD